MSVICLIDNTEHESIEALHKYIRPLMKQETYYLSYYKKICLGSGKPILFKNAEQYLSQDFIDKNQIKAFLKKEPVRGREWAVNWLKKRKEEKGLIYAPSQVELRSLSCPTMAYFDSVGGYYNICRELGFKDRYVQYTEQNTAEMVKQDDICIICDTREQKPLELTCKTIKGTINVGDYALAEPHDKGIRIERKSISDFASSLNCRENIRENKKKDDTVFSNLERIDRELARAKEDGLYVVMLVENSLVDSLSFDYLPQMRWSRVKPQHVFKNLRDLLVKYPHTFQAVFADGRKEAARIALKILSMGEDVKKYDVQYMLEKGVL